MAADQPLRVYFPSACNRQSSSLASLRLGVQRLVWQTHLLACQYLKPRRKHQPFFLLATHRSGSCLLREYLVRTPGVQCQFEVLCPEYTIGLSRKRQTPMAAIRHVQRSLHAMLGPVRGTKVMLSELGGCRLTLADLDEAFDRPKYIVLYRQSLAEQFLSLQTAVTTAQWFVRQGKKSHQTRVEVNPLELARYCHSMRQAYETVLAHPGLSERAVLTSYEELVADPKYWMHERICPLLRVAGGELHTSLGKQNRLTLAERVANYDEVADLLNSPLCQQRYALPTPKSNLRRAA